MFCSRAGLNKKNDVRSHQPEAVKKLRCVHHKVIYEEERLRQRHWIYDSIIERRLISGSTIVHYERHENPPTILRSQSENGRKKMEMHEQLADG